MIAGNDDDIRFLAVFDVLLIMSKKIMIVKITDKVIKQFLILMFMKSLIVLLCYLNKDKSVRFEYEFGTLMVKAEDC